MKLTPRLQAIAELIEPGSVVADIGTDHGYLPVYLLLEQICSRIVAADINSAPLEQAKETVAAFNCLQKIDIRQGNGLSILREDDNVDTVVIAGLGGRTIASILTEGQDKLKHVQHLILQPMSETGYLRVFLAENGFALVHESLAMEGHRLYEIILAAPGKEQEKDPFRLSLGPRLLEKRPPLFAVFLKEKIRKMRVVYHSLQRAKQADMTTKIREVEKDLQRLEEVLSGEVEHSDTH